MKKVLWISASVPYDSVGHAGGISSLITQVMHVGFIATSIRVFPMCQTSL